MLSMLSLLAPGPTPNEAIITVLGIISGGLAVIWILTKKKR